MNNVTQCISAPPRHGSILILLVAGALGVLLILIAGCTAPGPFDSPPATPTPDIFATKSAMQTMEAQTKEARATLVLTLTPGTPQPSPTPGTPEPLTFAPVPDGAPAGAGVIAPASGPFSSIQYHLENEWIEDIEGATKRIEAFAGAVSDQLGLPSQKGVVVILVAQRMIENNDTITKIIDSGQYLTPCQGGPVRVVDAVGEVLTLLSASGHTFTFDVPARQFLPPPGATPTPNPATDWVFTGRVDTGTTDPPPCATITLYRQAGSTWQPLAQTTPSAEGTFSLRAPGPRSPSRFLLSVQYPPGFAPALPVAGPGFVVVDNHTILSVSALGPGEYGGQRFRTTHIPHYDQMPHPPGTPTPPPLPPPPPGTWTPLPPTVVSPLATPTP